MQKAKEKRKVATFLQCKEIEENNRMGKTRDLIKKIRDTKGTFHAKIGSIKNRSVPEICKTLVSKFQDAIINVA